MATFAAADPFGHQYDPFPQVEEPTSCFYSPRPQEGPLLSGAPLESDDWEMVSVSSISSSSEASLALGDEGGAEAGAFFAKPDTMAGTPLQGSLESVSLASAIQDMDAVSFPPHGGDDEVPERKWHPHAPSLDLELDDGFEHLECDSDEPAGSAVLSFGDSLDEKRLASSILCPGTPPSEVSEDSSAGSDYQSGSEVDADDGEGSMGSPGGWEDLKQGTATALAWVWGWLEDLRTPSTRPEDHDCGDGDSGIDKGDVGDVPSETAVPRCWVDGPLELAASLSESFYPMVKLKAAELRNRLLEPVWSQLSGASLMLEAKLEARDADVEELTRLLRSVTRAMGQEASSGPLRPATDFFDR